MLGCGPRAHGVPESRELQPVDDTLRASTTLSWLPCRRSWGLCAPLFVFTRYNNPMHKQPRYTSGHAEAGLDAKFPEIETWPNQFPGYEIVIDDPEFTSVCPKTGLPDFGVITLRYMPDKLCLELKSLKEYLYGYRNLGIFQENIVNRVLEDVVRWSKPVWAEVKGEFRPRGGISTTVVARWPRPEGNRK
jgi:7-cyano-7-deazaguanine reductase